MDASRTETVESLIARYPHIPAEAVIKEDLLRAGMAFDDSALTENLDGEVKPKSYFIFSFDQKPLTELGEAAKRRPPRSSRSPAAPTASAERSSRYASTPTRRTVSRALRRADCASRWTARRWPTSGSRRCPSTTGIQQYDELSTRTTLLV